MVANIMEFDINNPNCDPIEIYQKFRKHLLLSKFTTSDLTLWLIDMIKGSSYTTLSTTMAEIREIEAISIHLICVWEEIHLIVKEKDSRLMIDICYLMTEDRIVG